MAKSVISVFDIMTALDVVDLPLLLLRADVTEELQFPVRLVDVNLIKFYRRKGEDDLADSFLRENNLNMKLLSGMNSVVNFLGILELLTDMFFPKDISVWKSTASHPFCISFRNIGGFKKLSCILTLCPTKHLTLKTFKQILLLASCDCYSMQSSWLEYERLFHFRVQGFREDLFCPVIWKCCAKEIQEFWT